MRPVRAPENAIRKTFDKARRDQLREYFDAHVAAHSSGVQFLHPVTKEELHSPFFFSDLQRWEYTPKVFCFWSTKCDFLDYEHQGRHIVKYSLSTKQGWEISTTLHSYYKVLMNTDVSVNTSDQPLPAPSRKKSHIAYDAESGSDDDEGGRKLAAGGTKGSCDGAVGGNVRVANRPCFPGDILRASLGAAPPSCAT